MCLWSIRRENTRIDLDHGRGIVGGREKSTFPITGGFAYQNSDAFYPIVSKAQFDLDWSGGLAAIPLHALLPEQRNGEARRVGRNIIMFRLYQIPWTKSLKYMVLCCQLQENGATWGRQQSGYSLAFFSCKWIEICSNQRGSRKKKVCCTAQVGTEISLHLYSYPDHSGWD